MRRPRTGDGCEPAACAVIDEARTPAEFATLIKRAGLFDLVEGLAAPLPNIVILVDLAGFEPAAPGIAAARVEALIDLVQSVRPVRIAVAASRDSSSLWAGNRDVYARAELAGYRYSTDAGNEYDIVDLGDDVRDNGFPDTSALAGTPAAGVWADADLRIVMAGLRSDAQNGGGSAE